MDINGKRKRIYLGVGFIGDSICMLTDKYMGWCMNKRDLRLDKYGINKYRYRELKAFCEQYPDWKNELNNHAYIQGVDYDKEPISSNGTSDRTGKDAIRLIRYERNCQLVEKVAKETDTEFWEYLIKAICYEVPLTYLISVDNMHLEKSAFYERRRLFFYLLDKEKNAEK